MWLWFSNYTSFLFSSTFLTVFHFFLPQKVIIRLKREGKKKKKVIQWLIVLYIIHLILKGLVPYRIVVRGTTMQCYWDKACTWHPFMIIPTSPKWNYFSSYWKGLGKNLLRIVNNCGESTIKLITAWTTLASLTSIKKSNCWSIRALIGVYNNLSLKSPT